MSLSDRIEVQKSPHGGWWRVIRTSIEGTYVSEDDANDLARELRYHCRCGHEDYCGSGCGGHTE